MLANDIVVAGEETVFSQLEVGRGIMPSLRCINAHGGAWGWGNAMKYLLTGDRFDAEEARRMNFVTEIVPTGKDVSRALKSREPYASRRRWQFVRPGQPR